MADTYVPVFSNGVEFDIDNELMTVACKQVNAQRTITRSP